MKKIISAVLAVLMIGLTACSNKSPAASGFDYKVGTAAYTHTNDSYGYTDGKNGRGAVSTTMVAAVFDNDGKIVKISIDEVATNIGFDATGQLADFIAGEVKSKKELGDAYGMKSASAIGKEWYQQVETLENWLEGKTVNALTGGATAKLGKMLSDNSVNPYNSDATGLPVGSMGDAGSMARTSSDVNSTGIIGNAASAATGIAEDVVDGAGDIINDITDGDGYTGVFTDNSWMDEDLKAGVTIDTTYIMRAVEKAYKNAK